MEALIQSHFCNFKSWAYLPTVLELKTKPWCLLYQSHHLSSAPFAQRSEYSQSQRGAMPFIPLCFSIDVFPSLVPLVKLLFILQYSASPAPPLWRFFWIPSPTAEAVIPFLAFPSICASSCKVKLALSLDERNATGICCSK